MTPKKPTVSKHGHRTNKPKAKYNMLKHIRHILSKPNNTGKFQNGKIRPFGTKINWYWDIRLWSPIIIILLIISSYTNTNKDSEPIQIQDPTLEVTVEYTEPTTPEPTMDIDEYNIVNLAILADTVGHGRNDDVKEIIMWVLINRVEDSSNGYGGTLQTEISRPRQWQGYNPNGIYLDSTYELAQKVYDRWTKNGPRPIYSDMLWFTLNGDGSITVRNRYNDDGKNRTEITFGQE